MNGMKLSEPRNSWCSFSAYLVVILSDSSYIYEKDTRRWKHGQLPRAFVLNRVLIWVGQCQLRLAFKACWDVTKIRHLCSISYFYLTFKSLFTKDKRSELSQLAHKLKWWIVNITLVWIEIEKLRPSCRTRGNSNNSSVSREI